MRQRYEDIRARLLMSHLGDDERRLMWRIRACTAGFLVVWMAMLTFLYNQAGGSVLP